MALPTPPATPRASIVIRAYNEAKHLPEVFERLGRQGERSFEVIVVDSGSTDETVRTAQGSGARIEHISPEEFTFGRSLNVGCRAASGEFLVFVSGHCYPVGEDWLAAMLAPFENELIGLVYGKQRGGERTKFSEHRHFEKTFPDRSAAPADSFFCNNANAAIRRELWEQRPFDETLTGLEDLDWAKWLLTQARKVAYTADGAVEHLHEESWGQILRRYEREAIALRTVVPEVTFSIFDFARLFTQSAFLDSREAMRGGTFFAHLREIVAFRAMQYWGTYRGAHFHKSVSQQMKEKFYYPK